MIIEITVVSSLTKTIILIEVENFNPRVNSKNN